MNSRLIALTAFLGLAGCAALQQEHRSIVRPISAEEAYRHALDGAERIALRDVDLTIPAYFQTNALITGVAHVRFSSDDARLYTITDYASYRPILASRVDVILPYERLLVHDINFAYLGNEPALLRTPTPPACQPTIADATLVDADPYLNPQRASLWRGADGTMLIVLFPANYRCPADGMIDPRYRIIPAGSTPWRTIRIASNLHLPPEVTLISAASVGEPISFARVGLSEAAISFPRE